MVIFLFVLLGMATEQRISSGQIPEMIPFLGARVSVLNKKGETICGELQFVGVLPLIPEWGLVCTISRLPGVAINSLADITLLDKEWTCKTETT
jgi:hypothetical protein